MALDKIDIAISLLIRKFTVILNILFGRSLHTHFMSMIKKKPRAVYTKKGFRTQFSGAYLCTGPEGVGLELQPFEYSKLLYNNIIFIIMK